MPSIPEVEIAAKQDGEAAFVASLWDRFNSQRQGWLEEKQELRNYIFATDTRTTSNNKLPWKNSTTIPKLCQIRDNLMTNYLNAVMPNDDWLRWEGFSQDDSLRVKADIIEGYMSTKIRNSEFRLTVEKLVDDYVTYGMAFATSDYVRETMEDASGTEQIVYVGAKARRISPEDIVFNPTAVRFEQSPHIIRSMLSVGDLKLKAQQEPEHTYWKDALSRREELSKLASGVGREDFNKSVAYSVDGFGSLFEYYMGDAVEVLDFYGDYVDSKTGELHTDMVVTVVDRAVVVRAEKSPNWSKRPVKCVGWRNRPDNLWSMGALDNLVGLQYRLDHLENLKADAMDLMVHPPLKIFGEVEEFEWAPSAEINIDEGGDVQELGKSAQGLITASNEMAAIEDRMELYAGAPREAMGIRSAGEKTAFEVQQLTSAASRIFQEKATKFEIQLLEPLLNFMLEQSRRYLDGADLIRVTNAEDGLTVFQNITREDIIANGIIRPLGARHFSKQSQDLQNLIGVFNSPLGGFLQPHTSAKGLTKLVNDVTGFEQYNIFAPNIGMDEQAEVQSYQAASQEEAMMSQVGGIE